MKRRLLLMANLAAFIAGALLSPSGGRGGFARMLRERETKSAPLTPAPEDAFHTFTVQTKDTRLTHLLAETAEAHQRLDAAERTPNHDLAREALASLPETLRSAVALVFFEGLNHRDAALVLGCAETTISWRIFTAKKQLKAFYRRHE